MNGTSHFYILDDMSCIYALSDYGKFINLYETQNSAEVY